MIREFTNIDLVERNSFGVKESAQALVEFESVGDLVTIFSTNPPSMWYLLSGGNNVLFTQPFEGVILTPVSRNIAIVREDVASATLRVDAGVEWDDLVAWAVERGLWGIENLSLIPGKCGAAPVQNIGAYGCEVKDVIDNVEMFCPATLNSLILDRSHCDFGYRDSVFKQHLKGKVIITSITITLQKSPNPRLGYGALSAEVEKRGGASLANIREAVCAIRNSKLPDPKVMGNVGSFFKNPVVDLEVAQSLSEQYPQMPIYEVEGAPNSRKLAAGWLIDTAGLKGYKMATVGVHHTQALVLVNLGGARGSEVLELAALIQSKVKEKFGVELHPEVNIL